jgi:hypothetical protein
MNLIEQLETLRISDNDFFGQSYEKQCAYTRANAMLDDCLEIIWKWLKEKDLLNE